ncbi:hypothetical protein B0O99DRAFT_637870 [Bisporella sp. PMI_857]|nr:hypothetical protein B0O99DRAFT_637870 [Bisporella sp. PMI_857]
MADPSIKGITEWLKALGPYQTAILFLAFTPAIVSWNIPSGLSPYLNPAIISISIALLSILSSKSNFSGPLRYGLTKYGPSLQNLYQSSPDGTIWILLLLRAVLPWTSTWFVSALALTWQYTLQHFREDIRDIVDTANNLCARATIAHTSAKEDVDAATRYEHDALVHGNQAFRDARQAEGIKASDFFDAASSAWAAIETATEAIQSANDYSRTASSEAESARRSYGGWQNSGSTQVNNYADATSRASANAESAYAQARAARNAYTNFQAARNQDISARERAAKHGQNIKSAIKELTAKTEDLQSDLAELARDVQGVRHKASQAVAKAEQGKLAEAAKLSEEASKALKEVEEEAGRIAEERKEVRSLYVSQVLKGS